VAEDLEHLEAAILDHQLERAAEQEVADQHAGRIAPDDVRRPPPRRSPSRRRHRREQGRGVDELDRGGELVLARPW
jgi:hypothetical protein